MDISDEHLPRILQRPQEGRFLAIAGIDADPHGTPHFGATSAEMKESGGGRYSDEVNREKPIAVR
jgi:hypothetical protein